MKKLSGKGGSLNISSKIQIVYFFFKKFWLSFMKYNFSFRIINTPKKRRSPNRVVANFKKMTLQEVVCLFKIALFTQSERLKNSLVKSPCPMFNQKPHVVIGHTTVWHTLKKPTRRSA